MDKSNEPIFVDANIAHTPYNIDIRYVKSDKKFYYYFYVKDIQKLIKYIYGKKYKKIFNRNIELDGHTLTNLITMRSNKNNVADLNYRIKYYHALLKLDENKDNYFLDGAIINDGILWNVSEQYIEDKMPLFKEYTEECRVILENASMQYEELFNRIMTNSVGVCWNYEINDVLEGETT